MGNDTTTPAKLGEDTGSKSKGRLPKHLTGIRILADPSHRKRTWRNWYYKLAALSKKKCNVSKDRAKKMGNDIGYWIFQAKELTFDELKANKEAPLRHWCGDHSLCGEWCYAKKAEQEGKIDIKKPLFDEKDAADRKAIEQVREVHDHFTSVE